jgi:broad specificity phosphatase PhoE
MEILPSTEWGSEAVELLEMIKELPKGVSAMLFLRHSHRNEGSSWEEIKGLRLTEEGKQTALEFGREMPDSKSFRLYYSHITRCKETAEKIAEGIEQIGGLVLLIEELPILGEYLGSSDGIGDLFSRDKRQFVNYWAANHYPPEIIEPMTAYSQRAAEIIWKIHQSCPENTLDIFITHDTTIMGLEFGWAGLLRDTFNGWVNYLGGFILRLGPETLTLQSRRHTYECHYPFWNSLRNE